MKVIYCVSFNEKFIPKQIEFLNQNFNKHHQTFYILSPSNEYIKTAQPNVRTLNRQSLLGFILQASTADRVVFNGLFLDEIAVIFSFLPFVTRKAVWIPWGGDLYRQEFYPEPIKSRLIEWCRGRLIRRLQGIATPTWGDYEYARELYRTNAKYLNSGCNIFDFEIGDLDSLREKKCSTSPVRIQIGNSGDPTNEHIKLFYSLLRFKDENIEIHTPLAYGDLGYIETVIARGKELFGNKFVPQTELIPPRDYNCQLASIDILVFNHQRQQGFGNLVISLYLGSKVFLHKNVSTWYYLSEKMGCKLYDTSTISHMSFADLIHHKNEIRELNRRTVAHLFDRDWQREMWALIYKK